MSGKNLEETNERILLGKILLAPRAEGWEELSASDFNDPKCRRTFQAIRRIHEADRIHENGNLSADWIRLIEAEGGGRLGYLSALCDEGVTPDNLPYHLNLVRQAAVWREIKRESEDGRDPEKLRLLLNKLQTPTQEALPIKARCEFLLEETIEKTRILGAYLTEQSIGLVYSWRGVGKTMFVLSQLDAISKGVPFGPWQPARAVPVLFVDGELPEADLQERLGLLDQINPFPEKAALYVLSSHTCNRIGLSNLNLTKPETMEQLKAVCLDLGVKVLALDNISSLCPGRDENPKLEWDPINQWALDLRFKGISTIFVHHEGNEGRQRGTTGREDNLDYSMRLLRPNGYTPDQGCRFVVHFAKSRVRNQDLAEIADTELWLTEKDGRTSWVWGSLKRQSKVEVLRLLAEGHAQKDVAEISGLSKGTVSKIRAQLIRDELITKMGSITVRGQEYLVENGNF